MQMLLLSTSFARGMGLFEHCREQIVEFLSTCPPGKVVLVPYAAHSSAWDKYLTDGIPFFDTIDEEYVSIHNAKDPAKFLAGNDIKAIFVGGGNSFRLLKTLQEKGLLEIIQKRVHEGVGFMGSSAGTNMSNPTIQTTNDMPIVIPNGLKALNLVDFQINVHFVPGVLVAGHRGETREQRINEYHQENHRPVVALPEPSWIRVNGKSRVLGGENATLFQQGKKEHIIPVGTELNI